MTPWAMNTPSASSTPSQMKEWLSIVQRRPILTPRVISTNGPMNVSSPIEQPKILTSCRSKMTTPAPSSTSGSIMSRYLYARVRRIAHQGPPELDQLAKYPDYIGGPDFRCAGLALKERDRNLSKAVTAACHPVQHFCVEEPAVRLEGNGHQHAPAVELEGRVHGAHWQPKHRFDQCIVTPRLNAAKHTAMVLGAIAQHAIAFDDQRQRFTQCVQRKRNIDRHQPDDIHGRSGIAFAQRRTQSIALHFVNDRDGR